VPFIVRRGAARGAWRLEAEVPSAGTALRILERWAREFPYEYAEVEGIAGVFATHDPATHAIARRPRPGRGTRERGTRK